MPITLKRDIAGVDWDALSYLYSQTLGHDAPEQLERTWSRSYATILAYDTDHIEEPASEAEGVSKDRLVGAARTISDGEREALIIGVAVLPDYQRRGIGTAMMQDLIDRLGSCAIVLTSSEDENTPFYRRLGFHTHKRAMVLGYSPEGLLD